MPTPEHHQLELDSNYAQMQEMMRRPKDEVEKLLAAIQQKNRDTISPQGRPSAMSSTKRKPGEDDRDYRLSPYGADHEEDQRQPNVIQEWLRSRAASFLW